MDALQKKFVTILRWTERYTKTDMVHLVHAGGWLSVGYAFSSLISFLMAIAFANLVSKEAYGTYRFVLSLGILIGSFSLTGLKTSLVQAVASGFGNTLRHAFRERLVWSAPMTLIALGTSAYYFATGNSTVGYALIVVALCNPLLYSSTLYAAYLNGIEAYRTTALYAMARAFFPALFLLTTLLVFKNSPFALVVVYFLAHTSIAFLFYLRTARSVPAHADEDLHSNTYGKHLSVVNFIDSVAAQLDKILVFHFVGAAGLAVYTFAQNIPEQINGLFSNIYSIALPRFTRRPITEIRPWLFRKMLRFGVVLIAVAGLYVLIAPWLFKTFFPQYIEAVRLTQILSLSTVLLVGLLPTAVLHAKKAQKIIYATRGIISTARIALVIVLVIPFGLPGVVAASLLSKCIDLVVTAIAVSYVRDPINIS